MIKVCYVAEGPDYNLFKHVARILQKEDMEFLLVAITKEALGRYKADGFETYFISEIFNDKRVIPQKELQDLDLKYGPYGISAICNSDIRMQFLFKDQFAREQSIARAYKFWEDFFDTHKIDYIIVVDTFLFATRTAYNVARFRGKPSVGTVMKGPGDKYFTICDVGEEYCWSEFLDVLAEGYKPLTASQRILALDFVKRQTGEAVGSVDAPASSYSTPYPMSRSIFAHLRSLIWFWKMEIKEKLRKDPFGAVIRHYMTHKFIKQSWWEHVTRKFFNYDNPQEERYVYLPLSFENEMRNLGIYHYWSQNQFSLIREIAESLPVGIKIYIKEHPGVPGEFKLSFLRKIQKIANVKVISPSVRGRNLIDSCETVIVLDGTSGWEGYLSRKPVIMLGSSIYFSRSRLIYKIGSPCELPVVLFNAIKEGSSIYDKNEEEWLWFIYSVISTCGEGRYLTSVRIMSQDTDNTEENYKKIAAYVSEKIKRDIAKTKRT